MNSYQGHRFAQALAKAKIETILIPDACVFAIMSRVTKVILGAHAVLADGSIFGISGALPVCRAAKAHLVPVVVCTGMYKLCPVFLGDDFTLLDEGSPEEVWDDRQRAEQAMALDDAEEDVEADVRNPYFDRVPADLVGLFITNTYVVLPLLLCAS